LHEVLNDTSVNDITQSYTKVSTWGRYLALAEPNDVLPSEPNLTVNAPVIVAAVVGNVNCDCSVEALPTFSWKITVFDEATGVPLAIRENGGPLPTWLTSLPNAK
jgi:hypothetical protein